MLIETRWMPAMRRFAAGIDLSEHELRLVVVSRCIRPLAASRIEWLGVEPLASPAMASGHVIDVRAIGSALAALLSRWPAARTVRALPCAMAVPGSLTWIASMPLPPRRPGAPATLRGGAADPLETAARAHAERIAGVERDELAVDWRVERSTGCGGPQAEASSGRVSHLTIAATARAHLEARIEAAAAAGVVLVAVDSEPAAALRALVRTAAPALRGLDCFAALWVGDDGVYGWRIRGSTIEAHARCPASHRGGVPEMLRELGGPHALACAVAGGDLEALSHGSLALADIGDLLGCPALPFACAPFLAACSPRSRAHEPRFAVAYGLALGGVEQ
jgi:hypothetical protein